MSALIPLAKKLWIRDCGFNECWLQDRICSDPRILGLGELEVVQREKKQSSGGRLDILLEDPKTGSMYEAEIMLGATDESHIIRTIEYWDLEQRQSPNRHHTAVLIAEEVNRRFFNVIWRFSHQIPIVAIQVSLIEAGGRRALHFTKILDTYEQPEDRLYRKGTRTGVLANGKSKKRKSTMEIIVEIAKHSKTEDDTRAKIERELGCKLSNNLKYICGREWRRFHDALRVRPMSRKN